LKGSSELTKEIQFETKLRELLAEFGFSLSDIISLLDPQSGRRAAPASAEKAARRPRQVKLYKNPYSGEIIETKGGSHRQLKSGSDCTVLMKLRVGSLVELALYRLRVSKESARWAAFLVDSTSNCQNG